MRVAIMNEGETSIRVIIDGDTVNDSQILPGEEAALDSDNEGIYEPRELGGLQGEHRALPFHACGALAGKSIRFSFKIAHCFSPVLHTGRPPPQSKPR